MDDLRYTAAVSHLNDDIEIAKLVLAEHRRFYPEQNIVGNYTPYQRLEIAISTGTPAIALTVLFEFLSIECSRPLRERVSNVTDLPLLAQTWRTLAKTYRIMAGSLWYNRMMQYARGIEMYAQLTKTD